MSARIYDRRASTISRYCRLPESPFLLSTIEIEAGHCHVWSFCLDQTQAMLPELQETLSDEERKRAAAFLVPAPRLQFIATRGALRILLGRYLGIEPAACVFAATKFGKPFLVEPSADIHFNVTHAGNRALIAIARSFEVGIDIEAHRALDDLAGLARMILSVDDLLRWERLPETERAAAFYAIWTRKEAVAKAVGQGLSMDFPTLEVSFQSSQAPSILRIDDQWGEPGNWTLASLDAAPGYSAALAARVSALDISQKRFTFP